MYNYAIIQASSSSQKGNTMRTRFATSFIALVLSLLGATIFLALPTKLNIGSHVVDSTHSRAWNYANNTVGSLLGYGSCPITGQSWFLAKFAVVDVNYSSGMILSADAERELRRLIAEGKSDEAYEIANTALSMLNMRNRSNGKGDLQKPLHFSKSAL